jgi:type I restriction enzyme S subunit
VIEIVPSLGRWPKATLGELCDIRGGFPAPQDDAAFKDGEIPFVRMKDVGRHHFTNNLLETEQSLNLIHFREGRYQLTPRGSILMPRSGSVALNHRAVLTVDAVIVSHLCALVPISDKVTTDFLYRFLCIADMRKLTKKTTGLDSIAFSDLRLVAVPLPPLVEQRRIAEVLDKAEALRAKRRAALDQLDSLTQSLFLDLFGDPRKKGSTGKIPTKPRLLGELTRIRTGKLDANAADEDGAHPFFTCAIEPLRINTPAFDCKAVLVAGNGDLNVKYFEGKFNA